MERKKVNASITQNSTKRKSSANEYATFLKTHGKILQKIANGELKVNKKNSNTTNGLNDYLRINKKVPPSVFLKKIAESYVRYSKEKEEKTISYINNLVFYNRVGLKYYQATYDLRGAYEREYNYVVSVCDYINKLASQEGYVPVFVTLTLPSEYHPTTTVNGKRQYNPKFSFNTSNYVKEGYRKLQEVFRIIHRRLTKQNTKKNIKMYYFKVIEMHKDYTTHAHAVLFFKKEYLLDKFFHLIDIISELIAEGELGEQFDARILDEEDKATAYVQKYLRKAYLAEGESEDYLYMLDGWRKQNKIRMFTHSNTYLNKADFIKILADFIENEEKKLKKSNDEYINRYAEISNMTQYFEAKNFELTHESVDATIRDYLKRGGRDTYWIFEERWAIDGESGISELFAKTTINKSKQILELLREQWSTKNISLYLKRVEKKVKEFVVERKRELILFEKLINENTALKAKLGIKQFENAKRNYISKLNRIESYYDELTNKVIVGIEKLKKEIQEKIKMCVLGTYDFRKEKDRMRYQDDVAKSEKLKKQLNEIIERKLNVIRKSITRILEAIQEKLIYLIETKYLTTKKIIFKAHYRENGEFYYHEKLYDKAYVSVNRVCDENIREELLSLSV